MTEAAPCTLRGSPAGGVRDGDAWDVAREVVALARVAALSGQAVILLVHPDGTTEVGLMRDAEADMLDRASLSLVGVYTSEATAEAVHDDIAAMPRGWDAAP